MATVIVLSNLAGVAVQFFYQLLGDVFDNPDIGDLWENRGVNVRDLSGLPGDRDLGGLPRHHHHREGPDRARALPAGHAAGVFAVAAFAKSADSATGIPFNLDWFSPAGSDALRLHRRALRVDLRLLGLGHRADGQRGVRERRQDPGPGGAAVCPVDPADLPARRRRDCRCTPASATEGLGLANEEISDNVFGALAGTGPGQPARPGAVPRGPRLECGQPDHHVPAGLTHDARHGHLPRLPAEVRHDPPRAQDPVLRHRRGRHRLRPSSTRC